MEVDVVSLSSEFPNDNPALHRGAIWVCLEPTGHARPCRVERAPSCEAEPPVADAPRIAPATGPVDEHEPASMSEARGDDEAAATKREPAAIAGATADEDARSIEPAPTLEGIADAESFVVERAPSSLEAASNDDGARSIEDADGPAMPEVRVDAEEAPPTEIVPSAELALASDDAIPIIVVEEAEADDLVAAGDAPLSEIEDEDTSAIVVEELDPVEASVEGLDMPLDDEPRREIAPPAESAVVLACERAVMSEPPASGVALAEPEQLDVAPAFESLPPDESAAARIDSSALPPAPDDPFTVLVCTLADVAIHAGAPRVAALLPGLLFDGRLPEPLDADLADALREAGLWDGRGVAPSFVAITHAWRAILRGTSDDFSACGAAMLDEWASDLLAQLLSAPGSAPTLRQELRTRGVAAFGLVEVAA